MPAYLGLVALREGRVVGHIAFTPVTLEPAVSGAAPLPGPALDARGLAPMAVLPDHQRAGVGTALVREGLAACRRAGAVAVFVLGHPDYYARFGFRAAGDLGLQCEYDAPPGAFMVLELVPGALDGVRSGAGHVVRYHPIFADTGPAGDDA